VKSTLKATFDPFVFVLHIRFTPAAPPAAAVASFSLSRDARHATTDPETPPAAPRGDAKQFRRQPSPLLIARRPKNGQKTRERRLVIRALRALKEFSPQRRGGRRGGSNNEFAFLRALCASAVKQRPINNRINSESRHRFEFDSRHPHRSVSCGLGGGVV